VLGLAAMCRSATVGGALRTAPLADLRRVRWSILLPLAFVANLTNAAIIWYIVGLLMKQG
jgi:hypothetical protein